MKKILLGITGSIAAYKAPYLIRQLLDHGYEVRVVVTKAALSFVTPLTLQALSKNPVHESLLDPAAEAAMSHIELARWADIVLIAPASANFIAKLASGFADDLLNTVCLATTAPIMIAPAMNQQMWLNLATQENISRLQMRGCIVLGPAEGLQACGEDGPGRMLEPYDIVERLIATDSPPVLNNKRILITAGSTHEPIDPVRYIANRSSGKMGYALAKAAILAGARVTLISGPVSLDQPAGVKVISVVTANDMQQEVQKEISQCDIFISAAAVADYTIDNPSQQKIKRQSQSLLLSLTPTVDILQSLCVMQHKPFMVGFAAETQDVINNANIKRIKKGVDLMVVNDVSQSDIGFESNDNAVTILSEIETTYLPKAPKLVIATQLMSLIARLVMQK